jgi:prevent-host-death family protein
MILRQISPHKLHDISSAIAAVEPAATMGKGMRVTSSEFQQNVGRYQDAAEQSPVAITKNGRVHTVLMSAAHFELITSGRIARKIEDADEETIRAIGRSEVSSDHAASIAFSKTGRRDAAPARGGPVIH